MSKRRSLFIKMPYLKQIRAGDKTAEGRANYPNLRNFATGDELLFMSGNQQVRTKIDRVSLYKSVDEMLEKENVSDLIPGSSEEDARSAYNSIYPPEKVRKNGGMRD